MNEKLMICFELGYKVEDKTGFRDSLTDLYGIGVLSGGTGMAGY